MVLMCSSALMSDLEPVSCALMPPLEIVFLKGPFVLICSPITHPSTLLEERDLYSPTSFVNLKCCKTLTFKLLLPEAPTRRQAF